jgi:hypothetical protein
MRKTSGRCPSDQRCSAYLLSESHEKTTRRADGHLRAYTPPEGEDEGSDALHPFRWPLGLKRSAQR